MGDEHDGHTQVGEPTRHPYFEVYPDTEGEARFRLWGANGEKMAQSTEAYASASNAHRAVRDVKLAVLATLADDLARAVDELWAEGDMHLPDDESAAFVAKLIAKVSA